MDALNNILNRVSARELSIPHPTKDEMNLVYKAALRAPDHAWLRPSSFIEVSGDGLKKLSSIFFKFGESIHASDEIKEKYKKRSLQSANDNYFSKYCKRTSQSS